MNNKKELPWGWYSANKEFTDKISSEYSHFLNRWISSRSSSPVEQYGALKSLVIYMNDAHNLCHSKDEYFAFWYDSIIASPKYISERESELKELETNLKQLQTEYESKQKALVGIEENVLCKLKENNGILQSDFLKMFDATVKNEVSELLYHWGKEGKIERVKTGKSYILRIK